MGTKVAFNTSDDIITKTDHVDQISVDDPDDYLEIQRCIDFVVGNNYKNVVLQFPDELMKYANYVYERIKKVVAVEIYILADTSYGSCCVDEVAASHVNADSIIHFGQSCLSSTENLPVLYIFGRADFNKSEFIDKLIMTYTDKDTKILLFYDVSYDHCVKQMSEELSNIYPNVIITRIDSKETDDLFRHNNSKELTGNEISDGFVKRCFGRRYTLKHDITSYHVLYIGPETVMLRNLIYRFNRNKVYSYNPSKNVIRIENASVNKSLMKRYYLIEKGKDANIVGIIMGTLTVARYKEMVTRLKAVLKHAGKKFYTFVIGKINIEKMANFMEIDIFVLIACPENSLIDSKEFYKPIVTPYEIEIACLHSRQWTGDYITDFSEILPGAASHVDIDDGTIEIEPEYSLITGQLRNLKMPEVECVTCTDVSIRNKENQLLPYTAGEYLSSRSWHGLEINCGKSEIKKAEEGRKGIAMGYENECNE